MRKKLLSLLVLLMVAVTSAWAQEVIPETLDFTSNTWGIPEGTEGKTAVENSYTSGGYTITLCGSSGNGYYFSPTEPYILLGKQGAYLQLPAFSSAVDSIKVVGSPNASTAVEQNIYVGDVAVSTATTGMKNVTQKYVIAENYRTAGTIYRIKVTSAHNTQIKKVLVYFTPASGYSVTMKDGVKDADNWTAKAGEGEYQALPLEGVAAGTALSVKYSGTKKVKSVKAVKKAPAPVPVTYTALSGGEVLHVGDIIEIPDGQEWRINNSYIMSSRNPLTVVRANITFDQWDELTVTEAADGAYYVIKDTGGWYYCTYEGYTLPVTGTSDGIYVTYNGILWDEYPDYTFSVHEP